MDKHAQDATVTEDVKTLHRLGYAQELLRRMSGFSNFAISMSIICILAGGITSFHQGFCSVGGASIGLGWPLVCLFSLTVAASMAQIASAFPTAGGLYHWASILGGHGWGWATAWFNLMGLIFVLAAINVGCFQFLFGSLRVLGVWDPKLTDIQSLLLLLGVVSMITLSQALFNHLGIRVTTLLTDFSGWWIMFIAVALTVALLLSVKNWDLNELVRFKNYSGQLVDPEQTNAETEGNSDGSEENQVYPRTDNIIWLFMLGFLLPAYTLTGFDASAHTSEETVGAAQAVPRAIVRSVVVSGIFGWIMLCAVVLAIRNMDTIAAAGPRGEAFPLILRTSGLSTSLTVLLTVGIGIAQYLCGLATVTSTSRMAYAFARDGGLPFSKLLRHIHPQYRTPAPAIWVVSAAALLFIIFSQVYDAMAKAAGITVIAQVYDTIAAAAAMFLYVSYVLPTALGLFAHGRTWTLMGPWNLGVFFRPLAVVAVLGCIVLLLIGMAPPNDKNIWVVSGFVLLLLIGWYAVERTRFEGPPLGSNVLQRQAEIEALEAGLAASLGRARNPRSPEARR